LPKPYRKPKLWKSPWGALVVGDTPIVLTKPTRPNRAHDNAKKRKQSPTRAEARFAEILDSLGDGALRKRYFREWAFADRWILDFYFDEIRLGIEVDGTIHKQTPQKERDRAKERSCIEWNITLLRVSNEEVFGPRQYVETRLRDAWRLAHARFLDSPYARLSRGTVLSEIPQIALSVDTDNRSNLEGPMGSLYRFKCNACGLEASTSGGLDCGFHEVTKTMYCRSCESVADISLYAGESSRDGMKDSGQNDGYLHCPRCQSTQLKAWSDRQPCPKCGGDFTKGELEVLWD